MFSLFPLAFPLILCVNVSFPAYPHLVPTSRTYLTPLQHASLAPGKSWRCAF